MKNNKIQRRPPPPKTISKSNNSPSLGGSFFGNMLTGFSFGTGSSLGHAAVGGILNSGTPEEKIPIKKDPEDICLVLKESLNSCLQKKNVCDNIYDELYKRNCVINQ